MDQSGRLVYSQIRGLIKDTIVHRTIEENRTKVSTEFLPLGVWQTRGFDIQMIAAYNRKEWNDACGWTYAVPLKSISWEQAEIQAEETIQSAERNVTAKKSKNKGKPDPELQLDSEEDSADENAAAEKAAAEKAAAEKAAQEAALKLGKKNKEKEAEKEKQKEATLIKKHNATTHGLASKAVTALTAHRDVLAALQKSATYASSPVFLQERLQKAFNDCADYLAQSDAVVKQLKKCSKNNARLPEITFSLNDLNSCVKNMKGLEADFKNMAKLCQGRP